MCTCNPFSSHCHHLYCTLHFPSTAHSPSPLVRPSELSLSAGVDNNIKELRDCIRRLRVQGAGAAEAELDELQAKLQAQAEARESEV